LNRESPGENNKRCPSKHHNLWQKKLGAKRIKTASDSKLTPLKMMGFFQSNLVPRRTPVMGFPVKAANETMK
jgi:hypothetical protein